MSGVEALSLACNIMQIISFAHETVSFCKSVYQGKSPDKHLGDYAASLSVLSADVEKYYATRASPLATKERALADVADKCNVAARALNEEVQFLLDKHSQGNLAATIGVAVKATWRKNRLERLQKSLQAYQNTLETHLLVQVCQKSDAIALQQDQQFEKLGKDLQYFVSQYSLDHTKMCDLVKAEALSGQKHTTKETKRAEEVIKAHVTKSLLISEASITKHAAGQARQTVDTITQSVHELHIRTASASQREQLLHSLKYPSMNKRRNHIADNDEDTFSWIFRFIPNPTQCLSDQASHASVSSGQCSTMPRSIDSSYVDEQEDRPWDSFDDWLKSDSKIYWISGKPGSGKSTLVKYLISAQQTTVNLNDWKPNTRILHHFFWKPGSMMERNIRGLLSSLLHQILFQDNAMIGTILAQFHWLATKESPTDWSLKELRQLCFSVLQSKQVSFCLFIDGMDEICEEDGAGPLLKLVADLKAMPNVKLCLASRPEPRFRRSFSTEQHLKLEDLTALDMQRFANRKLYPFRVSGQLALVTEIVNTLVQKAEGVFLWLDLAIRSLVGGLENNDSESELLQRLGAMPRELSMLYSDMWARLNESTIIYRKSAARYFNLMIRARDLHDDIESLTEDVSKYSPFEDGTMSTFQLMAATDPQVHISAFSPEPQINDQELKIACSKIRDELQVRCAGLVEIREDTPSKGIRPWGWKDSMYGDLLHHVSSRVAFIHRTAYDFLVENEEGARLRHYDSSSRGEQLIQLVKGELLRCRIYSVGSYNSVFRILLPLSMINDQELREERNKMLELTWKLYNKGYLRPDSRYHHLATPHFLAVASLPCFLNFILPHIKASPQPSLLATEILQDLVATKPTCNILKTLEYFLKPLLSLNGNINTQGKCNAPWLNGIPRNIVPLNTAFGEFLEELIDSHRVAPVEETSVLAVLDILSACLETRPNLELQLPVMLRWKYWNDRILPNSLCVDKVLESISNEKYSFIIMNGNLRFWIKALYQSITKDMTNDLGGVMALSNPTTPRFYITAILLANKEGTSKRSYIPEKSDLVKKLSSLSEAWLCGDGHCKAKLAKTIDKIVGLIKEGSHLFKALDESALDYLARNHWGFCFKDEDIKAAE